jgi:hypothetical protein
MYEFCLEYLSPTQQTKTILKSLFLHEQFEKYETREFAKI